MAPYRLARAATRDLSAIRRYTREHWGAEQARRYLRDLRGRMRWLAESPNRGQDRGSLGPSLRSFPQASHVIFYRRADVGIEVVRILHQRMEPMRHLPGADDTSSPAS